MGHSFQCPIQYLVIHCVLKQVKVFKDFEYHASIKRSHSLLGFLMCLLGNIAAGYFSDQSACNLNQCCIINGLCASSPRGREWVRDQYFYLHGHKSGHKN